MNATRFQPNLSWTGSYLVGEGVERSTSLRIPSIHRALEDQEDPL